MCHFYGWSQDQLFALDVDECESYWQSITVIEAQQALLNITTQNWSNISKKEREKIHRNLHKKAYPKTFVENKQAIPDDLKRALSGGMIGR
jgi:hypothetical protein